MKNNYVELLVYVILDIIFFKIFFFSLISKQIITLDKMYIKIN